MKLSKNAIRTLAVTAILLVVLCVIAFAVPFHRGGVFWVSFVFALVALCAQLYVLKSAFANGEDARSKFYGFPIAKIGFIYLVAQFVLSILFMALGKWIPTWVAAVLFVLLLAAAAIGFIAAEATRDEVERQDTVLKKDVATMRTLQGKANVLAAGGDPALRKLADELRYSDPVSSDALTKIESELTTVIDQLAEAVNDGDGDSAQTLAAKASQILTERNRLCKLSK